MKYKSDKHFTKRQGPRIVISIALVIFILAVIGAIGVRYWYDQQLKPLSRTSASISVVIPSGYSPNQIADLLQTQHVIRSATAFEWYVRDNDLRGSLKAGQYVFDPSTSVAKIVTMITNGQIETKLFTILPAQRLDQIEAAFIKIGFSKTAVNTAFSPSNYKNNSVLAYKPTNANLEGLLYPNSYEMISTTTVEDIIGEALDQMDQALTPSIINGFKKQGLNVYQGITLSSIVEQEVSNSVDRQMVAGVFLNRLKMGMMLDSDMTYHYAAIITGQSASPSINSPYNTYLYAGLPPGPISNVSATSLYAVADPIQSDYLYFVAGDNGKTYYSVTAAEHNAQAAEYCKILCSNY